VVFIGEKDVHGFPDAPGDARLLSYLAFMVREGASDLFVLVGAPPTIKQQGAFIPISQIPLAVDEVRALAYSIMRKEQIEEFEARMECDLSYQTADGSRFRANVHLQRGQVGMVLRLVTAKIPSLEELGLPPSLKELAFLKGGLVLTVGAAGSGKTTTLASMLDYRNAHMPGHILTIEDPIEYLHFHKKIADHPARGGAGHPVVRRSAAPCDARSAKCDHDRRDS
jgi:twitching motility protein PilU